MTVFETLDMFVVLSWGRSYIFGLHHPAGGQSMDYVVFFLKELEFKRVDKHVHKPVSPELNSQVKAVILPLWHNGINEAQLHRENNPSVQQMS